MGKGLTCSLSVPSTRDLPHGGDATRQFGCTGLDIEQLPGHTGFTARFVQRVGRLNVLVKHYNARSSILVSFWP